MYMESLGISQLEYGLLTIMLLFLLPSCDKEEILVAQQNPRETQYSIDPDNFTLVADSSTMAMLDSSQNLGYTYSKMLTLSATVQKNFAGSLSSMNNAATKITPASECKDQKEKESFFKEVWKSITSYFLLTTDY